MWSTKVKSDVNLGVEVHVHVPANRLIHCDLEGVLSMLVLSRADKYLWVLFVVKLILYMYHMIRSFWICKFTFMYMYSHGLHRNTVSRCTCTIHDYFHKQANKMVYFARSWRTKTYLLFCINASISLPWLPFSQKLHICGRLAQEEVIMEIEWVWLRRDVTNGIVSVNRAARNWAR